MQEVYFPLHFLPLRLHNRCVIFLKNYYVNTTPAIDVLTIIHEVNRSVRDSQVQGGLVTVTVPEPGGAVAMIEPLPEIVEYLKEALKIFPGEGISTKNRRKEEILIAPRVRAAMVGKSLSIPLHRGKLVMGAREEVVLIDLEESARRREFWVQVSGEAAEAKKGETPQKSPPKK